MYFVFFRFLVLLLGLSSVNIQARHGEYRAEFESRVENQNQQDVSFFLSFLGFGVFRKDKLNGSV